jgi:hypothetical protein
MFMLKEQLIQLHIEQEKITVNINNSWRYK